MESMRDKPVRLLLLLATTPYGVVHHQSGTVHPESISIFDLMIDHTSPKLKNVPFRLGTL